MPSPHALCIHLVAKASLLWSLWSGVFMAACGLLASTIISPAFISATTAAPAVVTSSPLSLNSLSSLNVGDPPNICLDNASCEEEGTEEDREALRRELALLTAPAGASWQMGAVGVGAGTLAPRLFGGFHRALIHILPVRHLHLPTKKASWLTGLALAAGTWSLWWPRHQRHHHILLSAAAPDSSLRAKPGHTSSTLQEQAHTSPQPPPSAPGPILATRDQDPKDKDHDQHAPPPHLEGQLSDDETLFVTPQHPHLIDQRVMKRLRVLIKNYNALSEEEYQKRIYTFYPRNAPMVFIHRKSMLRHIGDHFKNIANHRKDLISRGLLEQYVFLAFMMKLGSSNTEAVAQDLQTSFHHLRNARQSVRDVLRHAATNPALQQQHPQPSHDHHQQHLIARVLKLKAQVLDLSPVRFQQLLAAQLSTPPKSLSSIQAKPLVAYMENQFQHRSFYYMMHLFLGKVLGLEPTLKAQNYSHLHHRHIQSVHQGARRIRGLLAAYSPHTVAEAEAKVPVASSFETLFDWAQQQLRHLSPAQQQHLRQQFYLQPQDDHDLTTLLKVVEDLAAKYQRHNQLLRVALLYKTVLNLKQYSENTISLTMARKQGNRYKSASHEKQAMLQELQLLSDYLPKHFNSFHELYLYQQQMIERYSQEELKLQLIDSRLTTVSPILLRQKIHRFLIKHTLEKNTLKTSLLLASLNIPIVSDEHLATLTGLSPESIHRISQDLHQKWTAEEIVMHFLPLNHAINSKRFATLTIDFQEFMLKGLDTPASVAMHTVHPKPQSLLELEKVLKRTLKELSPEAWMSWTKHWGYDHTHPEQVESFRLKISVFLDKLYQNQRRDWSLFLTQELRLLPLTLQEYANITENSLDHKKTARFNIQTRPATEKITPSFSRLSLSKDLCLATGVRTRARRTPKKLLRKREIFHPAARSQSQRAL